VLETPTWRANADWGAKLGYSPQALAAINRQAIDLMAELRACFETAQTPLVISGNIGPRGDGYDPGRQMSADEAADYHAEQIAIFRDTAADMVSAFTMNYVEEAIGIARAAAAAGVPAAISFTVETDGRLPTGDTLRQAITRVDDATGGTPAYYMINCAHPTHFEAVLDDELIRARVRGLRANASTLSHAELDEAEELDEGDPADLGARCGALRSALPNLNVFGGCCGTDHRHVAAIAAAL
jgi:homocysteine S-methyltransferase